MTLLEGIVRPYQTREIAPIGISINYTQTTPPENVVVEIGRGGDVKTFNASYSMSISMYMDAQKKEKGRSPSRGSRTVRVKNPQDKEQWVDVKVTNWMWVQGPKGQWEKWIFDTSYDPQPDED